MKKWVAIASVLVLSSCSLEREEHSTNGASDQLTVANKEGSDGETRRDTDWDQNVTHPFSPLPSIISSTPEGESGEWGDVEFHVKRVYEAASDRTCREVLILYPDSPEPKEKLACGTANAAFFARVIF